MNINRAKNPFRRPWLDGDGAAAGKPNTGLKGIVAGGITGGVEVCITYPTEYVKTHLQLDEKGDRKQYAGIVDCVKKTVRWHGITGLYRGLSILVYGSIPKNAVRFGTFEAIKTQLKNEEGVLSPSRRMLSGLGAGVCEAIFAVTPMETIKVRFIHDRRLKQPRFRGLLHGLGLIIREEGFGGIYKGVTPTILKQGSNQAIRFYIMETLKEWFKGGDQSKTIPKYLVGTFGAFAGACSVLSNTPFDVVKTRMQGLESSRYRNVWDCTFQMWKKEGPLAFYKGTLPRLCKVCLDVGLTFMIYDTIMEVINKFWP